MAAIEVLAGIFAVVVLLKLVAVIGKPADWIKIAEAIAQKCAIATVVYLVLAVIIGYFVFKSLTAAQIGAVMLFTALLYGFSMAPYYTAIVQAVKETMTSRDVVLRKNWPGLLVWAILAVWIICKLFAEVGS